ncbi:Clp protease ClpP [Cronobacter dublinensis]|uniref:ATP-dependent Clp protease proteolytic subunit n=2 Tax=Cronobacter TaxID=413496 RepID=A0A423XQZ8_9ENTR|nr:MULTISPECIES: head maturation protease, ClpP-related [Cronobacter]EKA0998484.1 Clp protease ClpP [Cronobacter sakazakii]CCJ79546.1 Prophage Clp protease-like protein [Cronobacter dublinensis 1210]ALB67889.1 peptidase S14 [Cronobacter dublinensis subsp. dublinensis LMG 23823]EGT5682567.1 Clp protease ClpP [Cronobacter turicensis]EGT5738936.1 Clp protease ClpP [Cronobacter turicensis]
MTIKSLPAAPEGRPFAREKPDLPAAAMERWNGSIRAARDGDNSISIFDVIGADYWGEGVTASRIAGALRSLNGEDVTVNINSPGGDMFEGLAIYNLLREYDGKVTVKVLGLAASAASIIAMAGDEVQIGRGAFLMIHNCWVYAMGNRHDLAQIATDMAPFDKAMSDIYQARSGLDAATVDKMMDGETYIGGSEAVEKGFADSLLSADEIADDDESPVAALRKLDALLAKANTPRSERRKLLKALSGSTPGAAATPDGTPSAATIEKETIDRLEAAISGLKAAAQ